MDQNKFNGLVTQLRADLASELNYTQQTCIRAIEGLQQDYDERLQALAQYAYGELNNPDGRKLKSCVLPDGRSAHIIRETPKFLDVVAGDSLERWPIEMQPHIAEKKASSEDPAMTSEVDSENEESLLPQAGEEVELPDGTVAKVVEIQGDRVVVQYDDESRIEVLLSDLDPELRVESPVKEGEELVLENGNRIVIIEVNEDGVILFEHPNGTRGRTTLADLLPVIAKAVVGESEDPPEGDDDFVPVGDFSDPTLEDEVEEYYPDTGIAPPEAVFPLEAEGFEVGEVAQPLTAAVSPKNVALAIQEQATAQPQPVQPAPVQQTPVRPNPAPARPVITAGGRKPAPPPEVPHPLPPGIVSGHLDLVERAAKLNAGPFQMSALPGFIEQLDGMNTEATSWVPVVQHLVDIGKLDYHEDDDGEQWFQSPDCTIPIEDAVWGMRSRLQQNAATRNSRKQEREEVTANRKRGAESRKSQNAVRHKPR